MIVGTIFRVLWAATVFVFAVAVALGVLFLLGSLWVGDELRATAPNDQMLRHGGASIFGMVLFVGTVTPALTVLPAAIAAIVGEALRIRSWMYYVLGGGAAMAAIPVLASPGAASLPAIPTGQYMTIFAGSGFIGGFVYWLLAGRNA
jgi:hypothetical protein